MYKNLSETNYSCNLTAKICEIFDSVLYFCGEFG